MCMYIIMNKKHAYNYSCSKALMEELAEQLVLTVVCVTLLALTFLLHLRPILGLRGLATPVILPATLAVGNLLPPTLLDGVDSNGLVSSSDMVLGTGRHL